MSKVERKFDEAKKADLNTAHDSAASHKDAVHNAPVQKDAAHKDTAQHGATQQGAAHKDSAQHGAAQQGTAQHGVSHQGVAQHGASLQGAGQHDASQKGGSQKDASQKVVSQKDASQKDAAHKDVAQKDAADAKQNPEEAKHGPGSCPAHTGGECPGMKGGKCGDPQCGMNRFLSNECPIKNLNSIASEVLVQLRHAVACHGVGSNCIDALKSAERLYTRLTMMERQYIYPEMQRLVTEEKGELKDLEGINFALEAFHLEHNLMDEMFKLFGKYSTDAKVVHSPEFKHFLVSIIDAFGHHCNQEDAIWEKLNPMMHTDVERGNELNQKIREVFFSVAEDKPFTGAPSGVGLAIDRVVKFFSMKTSGSESKPASDKDKTAPESGAKSGSKGAADAQCAHKDSAQCSKGDAQCTKDSAAKPAAQHNAKK